MSKQIAAEKPPNDSKRKPRKNSINEKIPIFVNNMFGAQIMQDNSLKIKILNLKTTKLMKKEIYSQPTAEIFELRLSANVLNGTSPNGFNETNRTEYITRGAEECDEI